MAGGGSVFAKTTIHSAWPAFVMNVFEPFKTYSSPFRTAVDFIRATSEPASGSVSPNEQRIGSSISGVSHFRFCSSVPATSTGPAPRPVQVIDVPIPAAAPAELLIDDRALEQREAGPPVLRRNVEVHQPDLVRLGEDLRGMRGVLVVLGRLRPDLILGELVCELAQGLLLVRQLERRPHAGCVLDGGHGSSLRVD